MQHTARIWTLPSYNTTLVKRLQEQLQIKPVFCQLLVQRGIDSYEAARSFFRPQLEDLYDPFLMKDMDKAVHRLIQAIIKKEKIILYGDYDVDGTTAVALLFKFLQKFSTNLDFYIPDRYTEGYGISEDAVDWIEVQGGQLVIVLDCGIKEHAQIASLQQKGIDCIICDHHLPDETLPEAVAVLNPKRTDCSYPNKDLSGCTIGYKLAVAFAEYCNIAPKEHLYLLDLVALSIACDYVPILGENRILMHFGLQSINTLPCLGLVTLKRMLNRGAVYTVRDLVFGIGPTLNAAGRLDTASLVVHLLTADKVDDTERYAQWLIDKNTERRTIEQTMVSEAHALLEDEALNEKKSIVLYQANWHKGIVGIVAARMADTYYKPSIIFALSGNVLVGSARTAGDFDLFGALEQCSDLLLNFGGHQHAAGLTIIPERLGAFVQQFEQVITERISEKESTPKLQIDASLDYRLINDKFWQLLRQFEPFGPANMRPVFSSTIPKEKCRTIVLKDKHLKLYIQQDEQNEIEAIAFNQAETLSDIESNEYFEIAYVIDENTYKGKTRLQLQVRSIRV